MGHCITGIILKGEFDGALAKEFDLIPKPLGYDLTFFHIDHYYSACWQYKLQLKEELVLYNVESIIFPCELAIYQILKAVSKEQNVKFAIIQTDYFGGVGTQDANVFINEKNANKNVSSINQALRELGVIATHSNDEFDTVGLYAIRSQPDYLDKYRELADEYTP